MSFLTIGIVQGVVMCKSGQAPSRKSVYFGISKLILYFPYYLYVPCTVLFTVYFHTVISSLHLDRTRKQTLLIKRSNFVLTEDLPSISQLNVQAVTAKNEEQYALSNMIYIKLQIFFEVYFERGTPKMYTNQLKVVCTGIHFLAKFMLSVL